jgi:hypothetical protein
MKQSNSIRDDFNKWSQRFNKLAADFGTKHSQFQQSCVNDDDDAQIKADKKALKASKQKIKKHFFSRYRDTQSFWKETFNYLNLDNTKAGFLQAARACSADYLKKAETENLNKENCKAANLYKLSYEINFAVNDIKKKQGLENTF